MIHREYWYTARKNERRRSFNQVSENCGLAEIIGRHQTTNRAGTQRDYDARCDKIDCVA
jgi:hypothetical protein